MSTAPQLINIVQLSMRDGALSLNQPIQNAGNAFFDMILDIKRFLTSENAEKLLFISKNKDVKASLSDKEFRWKENSEYGERSVIFLFETQEITVDGTLTSPSFLAAFAKKN